MATMKQTQIQNFLATTMSEKLFASFADLSNHDFRTSGKKIDPNKPSGRPVVQNRKHRKNVAASRAKHLEQLAILFKNMLVWKGQQQRFSTLAKPRDQSTSIWPPILIFIRCPNPHIDVLQGPNMKIRFCFQS